MRGEITLINGELFNLLRPNYKKIEIEHIACSLSKLCRFNGQCYKFTSVAQHCCLCVMLARKNLVTDKRHLLAILLHDAAEAYCGDVIKPLKNLLGDVYKEIETNLEKCIEKKFGVNILGDYDKIKIWDKMAYQMEKILKDEIGSKTFECWGPKKAEREFLKVYNSLSGVSRD